MESGVPWGNPVKEKVTERTLYLQLYYYRHILIESSGLTNSNAESASGVQTIFVDLL